MANFLKYSELTYNRVIDEINTLLAADSRFDNFRESGIAQTLIEIFAACTDLTTYYIERRAEECFFDTAKLKSSIIMLAKQLGYVVQRPIPAESTIRLRLSDDLSSNITTAGDYIQVAAQTGFTANNNDFVLKDTFTYVFTSADIEQISTSAGDYNQIFVVDSDSNAIDIVQGSIKTKIIEGETNQQVGQKFQLYKIDDNTFSNRYGSEDFTVPVTKVYVGNAKNTTTQYSVDRRSLINWELIADFVRGTPNKVCLLRTSPDEKVELLFGDARYAELGADVSATGPTTTYDNIYIDYLSTKGAEVNKTGIIGDKLESSVSVYVNGDTSKDITANIEYEFNSNLTGGADLEDIESIKLNAPNIYYSLDRLVSVRDYVSYLKSLSSPIDIRNALAWGEQEELKGTTQDPIRKLFNVVMFCCVGSLYDIQGTTYAPKTELTTMVLDHDFNEDEVSSQGYFNLYVKEDVVEQLKQYEVDDSVYVVYGDSISESYIDIKNQFDGQRLYINYGSSAYLSASSESKYTGAITVSAAESMDDVAAAIEEQLLIFTDTRGTSSTNGNFEDIAFAGIDVSWNTDRFIVSGGVDDACFIKNFINSDSFNTIGLNGKSSESVSFTTNIAEISTNIVTVVDKLDERSMVTVRNVYISPIIQKFNITGTIYVRKLANKENLHTLIKNDIYKWLNTNADFNNEIYLSNIIEIIESYPDVMRADIALASDISTYAAYSVLTDSNVNMSKFADEKSSIRSVITQQLLIYLTQIAAGSVYINERTFYNNLIKNIYDNLPTSNANNSTPFRDSPEFLDTVTAIRNSLISLIRDGMLDTHGNLARQNTTQTINGVEEKNFVRGGYSLGCEIAKITVNTSIAYV